MNRTFMTVLAASLLGTASTAALTQESDALAQQGQSCEALAVLIEENPDRLQEEWIRQADGVVQGASAQECDTYYQQARTALDNEQQGVQGQGADAEAEARIVVTQPDPEVSVQQPAPEVSVSQGQPEVNVNQGQPDVLVRQTSPNVRVQVPQPTITIDQPAPEIIITMPEPDVNVATPEPQVEVGQAQPEVSVDQGEPQVQVQAQPETGDDGEADVEVQQGEAQVVQQPAEGEAQVNVQQQEPNIRYESAEPNVQVEQEGEPQIQFTESGEPDIQVRQAGDQRAEDSQPEADRQQQTAAQGTNDERADTSEESTTALLADEDRQMEAGQPRPYSVADIVDRDVINAEGQELGTVDRLVMVEGRAYTVLAHGGFLGMGEEEVALPLDSMSVVDGQLVMRGMTQQDIDALPEFEGDAAQQIDTDQQVEIGTP
ncbi:PRC-barrel domain-containing protein [Pelagibacterium montanilacus]|uniref:PRC-barrel domain-containing protein n=1 Tax=Pelagibacterium montanilacus TaxID=2185280 RepID=UPI000F8D05E2|nr:PRC-barrel domain-containing protein [Pelagibacterium montanilacus]